MAKFTEFSSGLADLFDKRTDTLKAGQIIPNGMYHGLPLVIKDGIRGVDLFGKFTPIEGGN